MACEIFANVYDQLMDDDLFKSGLAYTENMSLIQKRVF